MDKLKVSVTKRQRQTKLGLCGAAEDTLTVSWLRAVSLWRERVCSSSSVHLRLYWSTCSPDTLTAVGSLTGLITHRDTLWESFRHQVTEG